MHIQFMIIPGKTTCPGDKLSEVNNKNCHQSVNYWGGGIAPTVKLLGGHMPPCPPEVYAYGRRYNSAALPRSL